jgi:hypothetical protein
MIAVNTMITKLWLCYELCLMRPLIGTFCPPLALRAADSLTLVNQVTEEKQK